jgi:transposase
MTERFWLSDAQWAAIEPLLPHLGGKPRVDDRRVISGILHRFREGLRWRAIPAEYGPRTTLFNRFDRWSERGLWQKLLARLASCSEPPNVALVDSTSIRAHRSAAGAKGGSRTKRSVARGAAARPRSTRSATARVASTP